VEARKFIILSRKSFQSRADLSIKWLAEYLRFQIAISLFRDDFPWIYDAGLDVVKTLKNTSSNEDKRDVIDAFQELIEFTFEHPMMREMYMPDKDMWMMGRELPHILKRSLERYL
jgi:hypothetical protein